MRGLRRRIGERDGAIEGDLGLLRPLELQQECAPRTVEVEIAVELAGKRLDHGECSFRPLGFRDGNRAIERHDGRWLHLLECAVE